MKPLHKNGARGREIFPIGGPGARSAPPVKICAILDGVVYSAPDIGAYVRAQEAIAASGLIASVQHSGGPASPGEPAASLLRRMGGPDKTRVLQM